MTYSSKGFLPVNRQEMEERNIEVISGMNIPMLVKLAEQRSETMQTAVKNAQEAGRKYINIASNLL